MKKNLGSVFACVVMVIAVSLAGCGQSGGTAANTTALPVGDSAAETGAESKTESKPVSGGEETYKVHINHALSGAFAGNGLATLRGAEIAVDEINSQGGVDGIPLELIADDDKGQSAEAMAIAKRRYGDVMATTNGPSGTICLNLMPLADESRVAFFTPGIATQAVTTQGYDNVFRMHINDKQAAKLMTAYLVEEKGLERIAVIHNLNDFGTGGKNVVVETLGSFSMTPAAVESYKEGDVDFTAQIMKAKQADAQAIVIWGGGGEPALIAKQVRSLGLDQIQLAGGGGLDSVSVYSAAAGAAADHTLFVGWELTEGNARAAAFEEKYREKYKAEPEQLSYQNYDYVYLCAEALKTSGGDRNKFISAIKEVSKTYEGFYGKYSFDENGDNYIPVSILEWVDDQRLLVESITITPEK